MSKKERVLITGASAGIGRAMAEVFAEQGHDLALAARSADKLKALAETLQSRHGIAAAVFPIDLSRAQGARKLYQAVDDAGIEIDILVNNAGMNADGLFFDIPLARHRDILAVNIDALVALCHRFGTDMRRRRRGRILNVASTSAFQPVPRIATYAASKAFVLSFSEALAAECVGDGVSVTVMCPGFVRTDMTLREDGKHFGIPGIPVLEPRAVAEQGYRAVMRGRTVVVNGLGNRLLAGVSARQPRWLMHRIGRLVARADI